MLLICLWQTQEKDLIFDFAISPVPVSSYQCMKEKYDEVGLFVSTTQSGIGEISRQCFSNANQLA